MNLKVVGLTVAYITVSGVKCLMDASFIAGLTEIVKEKII